MRTSMNARVSALASTARWPGRGVVAVRVGDHGAAHRGQRIDVEIAGFAIQALGRDAEPGVGMRHRAPYHVRPGCLNTPPMMGTLPEPFAGWFAGRGWQARPHQLAMLDAARAGESALLIAPTGGGKTLAGFLPSLVALHAAPHAGLHTLYVSPLKALATDIARNLLAPVTEMKLQVTIETRTGDTSAASRAKQRQAPPNLLLTTPESLALMLSLPDAAALFATLQCVVIDEVHALAGTKRGDQLALCLARLRRHAPGVRRVGLSATVAHQAPLLDYVGCGSTPRLVEVADGAPPELRIMLPQGHLPWSGHMGLASAPDILDRIRAAGMTIVFVNTRAQGELLFQALWKLNEETLPIAVHHGSLAIEQRRRVEAAMAAGALRAVVATSSLDLGIDWGRRGPGAAGRRAQGHQPLAATRRPRQPPHGRSEPSHPGSRQPVRGAGMRGRHRRRGRARAGWRPARARRAGRAGAAPAADGVLGPVPPRRDVCGNPRLRPLRRAAPRRFRRRAALRGGWRLRAAQLRTLPQAVPGQRGPAAPHQPARGAPGPHEHRHHCGGPLVEGPPGRTRRLHAG